jgi:hypothetical protein
MWIEKLSERRAKKPMPADAAAERHEKEKFQDLLDNVLIIGRSYVCDSTPGADLIISKHFNEV